MNHYDTLGVPRDATLEEIRHAYLAKAAQLSPERFTGAPENVIDAVAQALGVMKEAWRVLGDPKLRVDYDRELEHGDQMGGESRRARAEHIWAMEHELGWPLSPVYGLEPPKMLPRAHRPGAGETTPSDAKASAPKGLTERSYPSLEGNVSPVFAGLETVADWLAPHKRSSRTIQVPDVCGLRASEAFYAVAKSDLHINFVRLTENPAGGDGVVVDQYPPVGTAVRRGSTLTVQVVHPTTPASISLD